MNRSRDTLYSQYITTEIKENHQIKYMYVDFLQILGKESRKGYNNDLSFIIIYDKT